MTAMQTADGTDYEIHGEAGAPAAVLIHGLGLARGIWDPLVPALSARCRVIAYDLWGHGESGPAPGPVTLSLLARQVTGLMDHLGIARAALLGFSIGGMIVRRVALDAPGRVAALAILNSPHDRGAEAQAAVEARAAAVREDGPMATIEPALERWFTPAFRASRPDVMDRVRAWRAGVEVESYASAAMVLAAGVRELLNPREVPACPTLIMTCEDDSGSAPAMSRAIAAEMPGADLRILPGLRHLGLMEAPEAYEAPLLDLLERTSR